MNDKDKVLSYLMANQSITALQALNSCGTMRLSARIWDLRRDGHRIDTEMVYGKSEDGTQYRYATYRLIEKRKETPDGTHSVLGT